jgi:hypothetical protein
LNQAIAGMMNGNYGEKILNDAYTALHNYADNIGTGKNNSETDGINI